MSIFLSVRSWIAGACLCCVAISATATDYHINVLATGLDKPWSIAELPAQQGFLVTEKSGQLLRLSRDGSVSTISGTPEVYFKSQGGLLDVVTDPAFTDNQRIYLSYAGGDEDSNRTTVASARLVDQQLEDVSVILEVNPSKAKAAHYGGKLAFLPDGSLLVSVGEGFEYREQAQSLDSEMGKLLRILPDGTVPADNPFPDRAPRVYSFGHRNPQGLAVDQASGTIWMTEHGPKGGDELNRIVAGNNYGWPAITYGVDYSGAIISPYTEAEGMEQPVVHWVPSIALSGLAIYRADGFPDWDGSLLIGALKDQKLYRLATTESGFEQTEPFPDVTGRIRDVRIASDGSIVALSDEGSVYQILPGSENDHKGASHD